MANWTLVQDPVLEKHSAWSTSTGSLSGSPGSAVAAGDTITVCVYGYDIQGGTITLADSQSNTYTLLKSDMTASFLDGLVYSCHNCKALSTSDTITVTLTGVSTNQYWGFIVQEWNPGTGFVGADDVSVKGTFQASIANPSSGASGTVAGGDELLFAANFFWVQSNWAAQFSTGGSYTASSDSQTNNGGSTALGVRPAYQDVASASGTYTASPETYTPGNAQVTWSGVILAIFNRTATATFIAPPPLIVGTQAMRRASSY